MTSLQNSPTLHRTLLHNTSPQKHVTSRSSRRDAISFIVKAAQESSTCLTSQGDTTLPLFDFRNPKNKYVVGFQKLVELVCVYQYRSGRRQVITIGTTAPLVFLFNQHSYSFAAENKKGFLPVLDKKDGYSFLYPFGWQEVVIEGQDKVFKDVIEPLESVSVNLIPTGKQDIREFGSPEEVAQTLIKKVLAPPNQKTKIVAAKEQDIEGKAYYQFEFIAQAPNYTRHALSTVSIGNGKFYTLTTGANERRWGKMKDRLQTVIESFKIFDV